MGVMYAEPFTSTSTSPPILAAFPWLPEKAASLQSPLALQGIPSHQEACTIKS